MKIHWNFMMGLFIGLFFSLMFSFFPVEGHETALKAEVFFAPSGEKKELHKALNDQMRRASSSIQIAMFQWTSNDLANTVKSLKRKAKVQIILDQDQISSDWSRSGELKAAGLEIRYLKLPGEGYDRIKMHHKFVVIDQKVVATGSMNWTVQADSKNYEALLVFADATLAKKFSTEFNEMWEKATPWN